MPKVCIPDLVAESLHLKSRNWYVAASANDYIVVIVGVNLLVTAKSS